MARCHCRGGNDPSCTCRDPLDYVPADQLAARLDEAFVADNSVQASRGGHDASFCLMLAAKDDAAILAAAKRVIAEERAHFHAITDNRIAAAEAWARDQEDAA